MARRVVPVLLLAFAGLAAVAQTPAPKLVLSQESWDFGEVWHPESPTLDLVIRNEGTADLKLSGVRSTCGCTVAQPEREVIPPGQSTKVKVRFDTQGKQKSVSSKVLFSTNDPARAKVEFPVKGFVKRAVLREPLGGVVLRSLDPSPGQSATLRLENQLSEPMKLTLVEQRDLPDVAVEIKELTPGVVAEVVVTTTKALRPGTTRGNLVFATGLSRESQFSVPVQLRLLSLVEPTPPVLFFDPTRPDEKTDRILSFYYYGDKKPWRVLTAECSNPKVGIEIGPTEHPAGMNKLKPPVNAVGRADLRLPPVNEIPPEGITLKFTTSDPAAGTIEVLVTTDRKTWNDRVYGTGDGD